MVVIVGIGSTPSFSTVIVIKFGWFHGHLTHKDTAGPVQLKTSETENDRGGKGKRTNVMNSTHGQLVVESSHYASGKGSLINCRMMLDETNY
jgi:hypothetical protein